MGSQQIIAGEKSYNASALTSFLPWWLPHSTSHSVGKTRFVLQFSVTDEPGTSEQVYDGEDCYVVYRVPLTIKWSAVVTTTVATTTISATKNLVASLGAGASTGGAAATAVGGGVTIYGWWTGGGAVAGLVISGVGALVWGGGSLITSSVSGTTTTTTTTTRREGTTPCEEVTIEKVECEEGTVVPEALPAAHSLVDCIDSIIQSL